MAFKLKSSSREPMSEINVTPFVDVMLVLLIIFMVTAPLLTVGVQVDLPESSADSLPEEAEPLTLTINSKGEIFIQESKVEYDKIIAKVLSVSKNRKEFYFSCDSRFYCTIYRIVWNGMGYHEFFSINCDFQKYEFSISSARYRRSFICNCSWFIGCNSCSCCLQ